MFKSQPVLMLFVKLRQAWVCARLEAPNRELCDAIIQKAKTMVAEFTELDVTGLEIPEIHQSRCRPWFW